MMQSVNHRIELNRIPRLSEEKDLGEPAYVKICDVIVNLVEQGEFLPGEILPGEVILADHWGLSRATVRRAFRMLVEDGYILKRQGAGTVIASRGRNRSNIGGNFCLSQYHERTLKTEMSFTITKCGVFLSNILGITAGSDLADVHFKYCDGESVVSCSSVLMALSVFRDFFPSDPEEEDLKRFLLKGIYRHACESQLELQAYVPGREGEEDWELQDSDVVINIREILSDEDRKPFAFLKYQMDSQYYRLYMTRRMISAVEFG